MIVASPRKPADGADGGRGVSAGLGDPEEADLGRGAGCRPDPEIRRKTRPWHCQGLVRGVVHGRLALKRSPKARADGVLASHRSRGGPPPLLGSPVRHEAWQPGGRLGIARARARTARLGVQRLDGGGRLHDPAQGRGKGEEGDQAIPLRPPALRDGGAPPPQGPASKAFGASSPAFRMRSGERPPQTVQQPAADERLIPIAPRRKPARTALLDSQGAGPLPPSSGPRTQDPNGPSLEGRSPLRHRRVHRPVASAARATRLPPRARPDSRFPVRSRRSAASHGPTRPAAPQPVKTMPKV